MTFEKKNLNCPYCGSAFSVTEGWVGYGNNERKDVTGFVCDNDNCEAEWDSLGVLRKAPRIPLED